MEHSQTPQKNKKSTKQQILSYIEKNRNASPKELTEYLGISSRAVFKHLKDLLETGELHKIGKPPIVFYQTAVSAPGGVVASPSMRKSSPEGAKLASLDTQVDTQTQKIIDENFMTITPLGEVLEGAKGFAHWCVQRSLNYKEMAQKYASLIKKYRKIKESGEFKGLIDSTAKLKSTFKQVNVDALYYIDFYSIEIFGKTKLGQKLLYAKQGQDKKLIRELAREINPHVNEIIREKQIDGVVFVPPTVKREVQLMDELEKELAPDVPRIPVFKLKTPIQIPQKTLSKLEDRIQNARSTFAVGEKARYKNVLIIDDAVGSGATINEIAGLLQAREMISGKVFGLAITGSLKGFDVISEV
ncbi:HTH domain-containing protein [candidate division WWE3 bacterium]|nr:HTH domain-containing protein [candidate division WWE3 bacterium]